MITLETNCGTINGIERESCNAFLGVPFAKANRFEYAEPVTEWESPLNATENGASCPQARGYFPRPDIPARLFYYKEFREGQEFTYNEDCLNVNIFTPKEPGNYPVIIFFYGGSFNSGCNWEGPFDGEGFAKKGIITVFANYRVGIFGYMTHEEIFKKYGREGNFGLDDQLTAIKWVKQNIKAFNGDPENITIMGQSAGAISVQYLSLNKNNEGLFKHAIMMSGGGKFPDFSLPKAAEETREYWNAYMKSSGIKSFEELKTMNDHKVLELMETFMETRKDNMYNTMPVIDGYHITESIKKMIKKPLPIDYLLGYTNADLYAPIMAYIAHRFAKPNKSYVYFFDVNPKGDKSKAFHSCDLRFVFNTLSTSWRPYEKEDYEISDLIESYFANFAANGNPNSEGLPVWKKTGRRALHLRVNGKIKMTGKHYLRLFKNMITEMSML